jgi:hypothetical protein
MLKQKHLDWTNQIDKIASAPYLLAACEEALAVLRDLGAELASHRDYMRYFAANGHGLKTIQQLQAAIAQARVNPA